MPHAHILCKSQIPNPKSQSPSRGLTTMAALQRQPLDWRKEMRVELTRLAIALLATTAVAAAAEAQTTQWVNDEPDWYDMVRDWAHTPRPCPQTSTVCVEPKDNAGEFTRCTTSECQA